MNKILNSISYALIAIFLALGCQNDTSRLSIEKYLKWLNDSENHLVKTKYVNGMEIKIKYLPPEYLTYREISNDAQLTPAQRDSLLYIYSNSVNFVLTLGPDERESPGPNVMFQGVNTYTEYTKRVHTMNFEVERFVKLLAGGQEYRPVLSAMENVYGLSSKRNILLAFVPAQPNDALLHHSAQLDFVYEDELFGLGINHFVFNRPDLENRPELIY